MSQLGEGIISQPGRSFWGYPLNEFCWKMEHSSFLAGLMLAVLFSQVSPYDIPVEESEDKVFLTCNTKITPVAGTMGTLLRNDTNLDLGKRILDPRGVYRCKKTDGKDKESYLQVYYRMCQNCVELNSGTLAGIIIGDIIASLLLALGVYCFAGHETGRLSKTADTQTVLGSDQLYQPLRDRNDAQYSHLGEKWPRKK